MQPGTMTMAVDVDNDGGGIVFFLVKMQKLNCGLPVTFFVPGPMYP